MKFGIWQDDKGDWRWGIVDEERNEYILHSFDRYDTEEAAASDAERANRMLHRHYAKRISQRFEKEMKEQS